MMMRILLQSYELENVLLRRQNTLQEVEQSTIYPYLWLYSHHTV